MCFTQMEHVVTIGRFLAKLIKTKSGDVPANWVLEKKEKEEKLNNQCF